MKKNNKGFTLVEVLAAITILGILSMVAIPRIFDLINNSRNDVYVQDARRFMAQTKYLANSPTSGITKPSVDNCVVLSLKYLNASDFATGPHGGAYVPENSYAVIRAYIREDEVTHKKEFEYDYAVLLVEKTKDGRYIGMSLIDDKHLQRKSAVSKIKEFSSSELKTVNRVTKESISDVMACSNIEYFK